MAKSKTHLVIVGGGFGGIKLAREMSSHKHFRITLVSDNEYFRYAPALYRTATGHRGKESAVPIKMLLEAIPDATFVQAKAEHIDREEQIITLHNGRHLSYDYAVFALGVVTSYFGIKGLEEYSYGIKSSDEIDHLRSHIHQNLLSHHELDKNYVVVGGGPTGVELSAALRYYLTRMAGRHRIKNPRVNIDLIEAADRILPSLDPKASKKVTKRLQRLGVRVMTKSKVQGENSTSLMANGKPIATQTVIWTAGVTNNPFFADNVRDFTLNEHKKVVVDDYLRVDEHLFVIGDNAATPFSGLALTAIHDAKYVAKYLDKTSRGKQAAKYKPFKPISAVPVGPMWAIAQWGKLVIGGFVGSIVRIFADLVGYIDIMGITKALRLWLRRYEYEETCPVCNAVTLKDIVND